MKILKLIESSMLTFAVIFLFSVSTGWAATYYIDYQSGLDSNNGMTSLTPFKHCPGDPRAMANANIILSAGDIVVFKGGVTYAFSTTQTDFISANASGISGNEIIYRSGHIHDVPWPSPDNRAVIDGTNVDFTGVTGVISLNSYNHIKIEGLKIQNSPWNSYSGCISSDIATEGDITIEDVELTGCSHGIYIRGEWFDDGSPPSGYTVSNSVIYSNAEHGMLVRAGVKNVRILRNEIYHNGYEGGGRVGDGIFFANGGDIRPSDITVSENNIYDHINKGHILLQGADNVVIEKNYLWENNEYVRFGISLSKGNNITIRNNVIVDTNETAELEGLIRIWVDNSIPTPKNMNNVYIFNNTLIGESAGHSIYIRTRDGYSVSNIVIKNNIIDAGGANYICYDVGIISAFDSDANLFSNGDAQPFCWGASAKTLSEWQGLGMDINSQEVDPSLDLSYKPDSLDAPVVDSGEDLSYTGFSYDKNGTLRPQGEAWDVGAYEYMAPKVISNVVIPPAEEVIPPAEEAPSDDDECLIVRAYGSSSADDVKHLRQFRDRYLMTSSLGRVFVDTYYRVSPVLADYIEKHEYIRAATRCGLKLVVYIISLPKF